MSESTDDGPACRLPHCRVRRHRPGADGGYAVRRPRRRASSAWTGSPRAGLASICRGVSVCWARSRPSVAVDLKHAEGLALAADLIGKADGLIEGFPARHNGTPRPRSGGGAQAQSAPRLRPDDRLGTNRVRWPRRPATISTISHSPARWPPSAAPAPSRRRRLTSRRISAAARSTSPSAWPAPCSKRSGPARAKSSTRR